MSGRNHIVVTTKGVDIQFQVLKEASSSLPRIQSQKEFNARTRRQKTLHSSMTSAELLASYTLPKPGYFGPKEQTVSRANPNQHYHFYPNYLKKDPKDYPKRHVCSWKPHSTTKGDKEAPAVNPKGRYVHHSLYNYAMETKLVEDPSVEKLNRLNYHKGSSNVENLEEELSKSLNSSGDGRNSMWMDNTSKNNSPMLNNSKFGYSRFGNSMSVNRTQYSAMDMNKEEKMLRKHLEHERNYEQLLNKFAEVTKKSLTKYLENTGDRIIFMKTLKNAEQDIGRLEDKKNNEDLRLMKRLKDFQAKKYEKAWNDHRVKDFMPQSKSVPRIKPITKVDVVKEKPAEIPKIEKKQTIILNEISARSTNPDKTPLSNFGRSPTHKLEETGLKRFNSKKTES